MRLPACRHEMLTQRALFCHRANTKRGTLSQHFVTCRTSSGVGGVHGCVVNTNNSTSGRVGGGVLLMWGV